LAEAIPDDERRSRYDDIFDDAVIEIQADLAEFAQIGNEEVRLASEARLKNCYVSFLYEINESKARDIKSIDEEIAGMQSDLAKAEKAANGFRRFFWQKQTEADRLNSKLAKAEVDRLTSKLAEAEQQRDRMLQEIAERKNLASRLYGEAVQGWKDVSVLHKQLVGRVWGFRNRELVLRYRWGDASKIFPGFCNYSIPSIPKLMKNELMVLRYLAVIHSVELLRREVDRVEDDIRKALRQMPDCTWFCENGGNRELYDRLQASFGEQIGKYCDRKLANQLDIDSVCSVVADGTVMVPEVRELVCVAADGTVMVPEVRELVRVAADGRVIEPVNRDWLRGVAAKYSDIEATIRQCLRALVIAAQREAKDELAPRLNQSLCLGSKPLSLDELRAGALS
jgi:hypothetical protein